MPREKESLTIIGHSALAPRNAALWPQSPEWQNRTPAMMRDWTVLTEDAQLRLAREALSHAAELIATQAEFLASEMDVGGLSDRGGADALRLLAAIIRLNGKHPEDGMSGRA